MSLLDAGRGAKCRSAALATPSYRPYRIATMPVTSQVILPALLKSLPSFFAIALISTSAASNLLVHRNYPTFDLIEVQDQQLIGQQQCTTKHYFYAPRPAMQPAIMDLFSSLSGSSVSGISWCSLYFLSSPSPSFRPLPRQLFSFIVITPLPT